MNSIRRYFVSAVLTALVIAILWAIKTILFRAFSPYPSVYIILALFAFLVFSIPFILLLKKPKNERSAIKLIYIVSICFILNYPIRAIYRMFNKEVFIDLVSNISHFNEALSLAILTGIVFYASYYFFIPSKKEIGFISHNWDGKKLDGLLTCILLIYILLAVDLITVYYLKINLPIMSSVRVILPTIAQIVVVLSFINFFKFGKSINLFWLVVMPLQIVMGIILKTKEPILMPIIYLFLINIIIKRKINYKIILFGIIVLILSTPIIQTLRNDSLSDFTSMDKLTENLVKGIEYPLLRMHSLDSLTVILNKTPEVHEFKHGKTLLLLPYSFVPRIIWPDKPVIPLGYYFAKEYVDKRIDASLSISLIGDLYWNFGIISVILGAIIFGLLFRFVSIKLEKGQMNESKIFLLSLIAYYALMDFVSESISLASAVILRVLFLAMLLIALLNQKEKNLNNLSK